MLSTCSISHGALAAALLGLSRPRGALCVCIDGAGGSGKTTIARGLAGACPSIQIVHMDDFYRPSRERHGGPPGTRPIAADFDRERLMREVLAPLRARRAVTYGRYDWTLDAVLPATTEVAQPIVVVEGVYSASAALAPFFDLSFWVECPRDVRLARGLARDGQEHRPRWELDWMPGEDRYIEAEHPEQLADVVCDGARVDPGRSEVIVAALRGRARAIALDR